MVGVKASLEPMDAAAMICTAHPQSIEATAPIDPMVFASANPAFQMHRVRGKASLTPDNPAENKPPPRRSKGKGPKIQLMEIV